MAGRPRHREFVRKLEAAAKAAGFEDPTDYFLERVGNGESMKAIAWDIGQMSRWTLLNWVKDDPKRYDRYDEARRLSAGALIDDAQQILDQADTNSPAAVSSARDRAGFRQWQAARYDRKQFGKDSVHHTHISIGNLHLDALRKLGNPEAQRALPAPSENGVEVHDVEPIEVEEPE